MVVQMAEAEITGTFSSSDEEDDTQTDFTPLHIDWLDLSSFGCGNEEIVGVTALPGCRFKDVHRSLQYDIDYLKRQNIQDIVSLCTKGELNKYRVPQLLSRLSNSDITVHHYPFPDGQVPSIGCLCAIIDQLKVNLMNTRKTVVHCYGGLGRSALVAVCFMLMIDENLTPECAISRIRNMRGPRAVQTVKQYNFINDFRSMYAEYDKSNEAHRSISR